MKSEKILSLLKKYSNEYNIYDIFGIIIYSNKNAHTKLALSSEVYWLALDEISGPNWAILTLNLPSDKREELEEITFDFLVSIDTDQDDYKSLLNLIALESIDNLPVIVIFSFSSDGYVRKQVFNIDDTNVENVFNSVKTVLHKVAKILKKADKKKKEDIWPTVNYILKQYKGWQILQNGLKLWAFIRNLI